MKVIIRKRLTSPEKTSLNLEITKNGKRSTESLGLFRLIKYYTKRGENLNLDNISKSFESKFEQYSEEQVVEYFTELGKRKELAHIIKGLKDKLASVITPEKAIKSFVTKLLDGEENVLFQKYKFFKFYKD
jgi:hypothetical protein